jgi:hypothetical protein
MFIQYIGKWLWKNKNIFIKYIKTNPKQTMAVILTAFIASFVLIGIFYYAITNYKHYQSLPSRLNLDTLHQKIASQVENCDTQNGIGIGEIDRQRQQIRFSLVQWKNSANEKSKDLSRSKESFYSVHRVHNINNNADDLWKLMEQLKNKEVIGILPLITGEKQKGCRYAMKILHKQFEKFKDTTTEAEQNTAENSYFETHTNIEFFLTVFKSLNTDCKQIMDITYGATNLKVVWIAHHSQRYFIWWSFAEEGRCAGAISRAAIHDIMGNILQQINDNADNVNIKEFFSQTKQNFTNNF